MPTRGFEGRFAVALAAAVVFWSTLPALTQPATGSEEAQSPSKASEEKPAALEKATFGAGCFWCSEAVFQELKGVKSVVAGYSGGKVVSPTYAQVSTGTTGHAEVVQVTYDPEMISYEELLKVFWKTHNPTTLNRQGPDVGTQYRSVIFYHGDEQKELAEKQKQKLQDEHEFSRPIVTEITRFDAFYPAEDYHQDYFKLHGRNPYCARIVRPKVAKVKKEFKDKVK
jgi:peptide-methionine (S)-S-oxide reductase